MSDDCSADFSDCRSGAVRTSGGLDLPDLWRVIHLNGRLAERVAEVETIHAPGPHDELDRAWAVHKGELASVPIGRWQGLCSAAGWTWLGAAVSSWCADAHQAQVWAAWRSCTAPLEPRPAFHYAASLMNPEMLSSNVNITEQYIDRDLPDYIILCVMLSAAPSRLVIDDPIVAAKLKRSPFLLGRERYNG